MLVEQSVLGWKEYELEVMRDSKDNAVIICSIENFDPMGVHTGDSITIAPAMTLTDKEYQLMRDAALAVIREIGVETGGSNIQFAVNPENGRMIVIEMNPRVSRSSALASKATGFPIAKIATKLAVGYTLDEIPNDITRETPACFEPTIDYVVTKVPRFAFEKFPGADDELGPQMKSVGEVMAIGRTFKEALGKALRSLEIGRWGFDLDKRARRSTSCKRADRAPQPRSAVAARRGDARRAVARPRRSQLTKIDPWFLRHLREMVDEDEALRIDGAARGAAVLDDAAALARRKRMGMSDRRITKLTGTTEEQVRQARLKLGIRPVFKRVDTCAAEFEAQTPYLYSTYETGFEEHVGGGEAVESEGRPTDRKKIIILGGGPNRIGQGIEFDYCCVHAVQALREDGYETIMVNCNPETVSTDYDTSDRLYFEPLTREDVLEIVDAEKPDGVIVQFGGQTPLRLAVPLQNAGVKLLGTSADAIDRAEDRERFGELLKKLDLRAPAWGTAHGLDEARAIAERIGYPVMVRPSYVLGGRAMEIVHDPSGLAHFVLTAMEASRRESLASRARRRGRADPDRPVPARRHRGRRRRGRRRHTTSSSAASWSTSRRPASTRATRPAACRRTRCRAETVEAIKTQARALARELGVRGLMNMQFAVPRDGRGIFILEVNPRASRTVPFVSKATGVPLAKIAARIAVGKTLRELGVTRGHAHARRGQGGGVPVREVRGRRHHPRPGDALDRRGHGHRPPTSPPRSARARSAPAPAADGRLRVPVGAGQRQGGRGRGRQGAHRPRLRGRRHRRHARRSCTAAASTSSASTRCARGGPTASTASSTATSTWSSTRPRARRRSRIRSRSAAPRCSRASPTTRRCRRRAPPWAPSRELRAGKMTRALAAGVPETWLSSR